MYQCLNGLHGEMDVMKWNEMKWNEMPNGDWSTSSRVNFCEMPLKGWLFTLEQMFNPGVNV